MEYLMSEERCLLLIKLVRISLPLADLLVNCIAADCRQTHHDGKTDKTRNNSQHEITSLRNENLRLEVHGDERRHIACPRKRELRARHRNVAERSFDALQFRTISSEIDAVLTFLIHLCDFFGHIVVDMAIDIFFIIRVRIENCVMDHGIPLRKKKKQSVGSSNALSTAPNVSGKIQLNAVEECRHGVGNFGEIIATGRAHIAIAEHTRTSDSDHGGHGLHAVATEKVDPAPKEAGFGLGRFGGVGVLIGVVLIVGHNVLHCEKILNCSHQVMHHITTRRSHLLVSS